LGTALPECLAGLGRIVAVAHNPKLTHSNTWDMISRALNTGVPGVYRDIQVLHPGTIPAICKVDLMQSVDGRYYIAEIDGHNKHGLGYMALHANVVKAICPDAQTFPGITSIIAQEMERRNGNGRLVLLYSHKERYYLAEFQILAVELAKHGIELIVVDDVDVEVTSESLLYQGEVLSRGVFVDLPFLDKNPGVPEILAEAYSEGKVDFLLPPKPFFSSKAVMALLRNDEGNLELEAILRSQIPLQSLELVRGFIPETYLVTKGKEEGHWDSLLTKGSFVIKEVISSGMKGTAFQEDARFAEAFRQAQEARYRFVLQKEMQNAPLTLKYFTEDGDLREGEWFGRIIVHFTRGGIAEVELTARMDKRIHGAPDCLQLGTVIETNHSG